MKRSVSYRSSSPEKTMTNKEYVKTLLEEATQRHGENAFSTRMLRQQYRINELLGERGTEAVPEVPRRGEEPRGPPGVPGGTPGEPPGGYVREPVLSLEERAQAEAEEDRVRRHP